MKTFFHLPSISYIDSSRHVFKSHNQRCACGLNSAFSRYLWIVSTIERSGEKFSHVKVSSMMRANRTAVNNQHDTVNNWSDNRLNQFQVIWFILMTNLGYQDPSINHHDVKTADDLAGSVKLKTIFKTSYVFLKKIGNNQECKLNHVYVFESGVVYWKGCWKLQKYFTSHILKSKQFSLISLNLGRCFLMNKYIHLHNKFYF